MLVYNHATLTLLNINQQGNTRMLSLLSSTKDFTDPWVGSPILNRLGLHISRIRLANVASSLRRRLSGANTDGWTSHFSEHGYVVIPDFLPEAGFDSLYTQVKEQTLKSLDNNPPIPPMTTGFGEKQAFDGGFDRYDGSTLNRFLEIENPNHQPMAAFTEDPRLDSLCRAVSGFSLDANRLQIYLTVNGEERENPDIQKVLHKDTFHSSLKFWYFLEDVNVKDGPFVYVPGSHKVNAQRLKWEHHQALVSCGQRQDAHSLNDDGGGSFRLHEDELSGMGLPSPLSIPVAANTLILADTLGFHRRGDATPGTQRLALYGWRRPWPFLIKGW